MSGKKCKVIEELYRKNIDKTIKQEAVVLADELIKMQNSKTNYHQFTSTDGLTIMVKTIGIIGRHIYKKKINPFGKQH